ncbi:hypothetical protein MZO42_15110 [Sphingomonas psychrotolerans]|uniref:Uncharacterized protein n=1 Tax=Sphingomonas psychrotolerans TaxID=1327635 RepID=A0ABU3N684_9SPHN|nr:hypothetical protein [Sphingomonas psychrotolerans]MDT8760030.1 hypothetical protein [Sphingomonas psychrotolerans]
MSKRRETHSGFDRLRPDVGLASSGFDARRAEDEFAALVEDLKRTAKALG